MQMENIEIEVMGENYIVVRADTKRFGARTIMYESYCFDDCFNYLKRELDRKSIRLTSNFVYGCYTDVFGRSFPTLMWIA